MGPASFSSVHTDTHTKSQKTHPPPNTHKHEILSQHPLSSCDRIYSTNPNPHSSRQKPTWIKITNSAPHPTHTRTNTATFQQFTCFYFVFSQSLFSNPPQKLLPLFFLSLSIAVFLYLSLTLFCPPSHALLFLSCFLSFLPAFRYLFTSRRTFSRASSSNFARNHHSVRLNTHTP